LILSNKRYQIEIVRDEQYTLFSTDNKFYSNIILLEEYSRSDFVCGYSIAIKSALSNYKVAIIGRAYGSVENCAVLEDGMLVMLVDNYLIFFNLINQELEKKIQVLDYGTGIEMYPFDDGYIINSEIDIIKVDKFGRKIWSFSGQDIWVRPNGESSIKILDEGLLLIDWEGHNYHLNKWGKDIS